MPVTLPVIGTLPSLPFVPDLAPFVPDLSPLVSVLPFVGGPAQDSPERTVLQPRDVAFDWSELPVHWVPDEPFTTHLLNVVHMLFPEAEEFFVRLFTDALPLIRDPQLAEDVRGFIGQEAVHAVAHQGVLEQHFAARGVDTSPYTDDLAHTFRVALSDRDLTGPEAEEWLVERVALVAAIEHMTSFLGQWILDANALDKAGADPAMLDLLRWHGAEEVEHRAVAHDLYMHLDGRYWRRLRAQLTAGPMLVRLLARGVGFLMARDPEPSAPSAVDVAWAMWRGLVPGPLELATAVVTYLRPDFHPSQHASTAQAVTYLALSPAARAAAARGDAVPVPGPASSTREGTA